jgi:CDP-diglyceride synthetase
LNIFKSGNEPNKPVNAIISLAVALMALQFNLVSNFFANIFPRFGVALAILLVILILLGFFTDLGDKNLKWFLYAIVLITVIAVLWGPLGDLGFNFSLNGWLVDNIGWIIFVVIMVGLVVWALGGGKKGSSGRQSPSE